MEKNKRFMRLLVTLIAAFTLIAGTAVTSFAAEANQNVTNDRNGVVQVKVVFQGNDADYLVQWGSGFLVNDMTVLTCHHVVYVDDETLQLIREDEHLGPMVSGKTDKQIRDKMALQVTVYSDSSVSAEVIEGVSSRSADFVALKLKTALVDYSPLTIRDTKDNPVVPTEACYVLGFPYKMMYLKGDNANKFAPENVEVTPGTVKQMDTNSDGFVNITMTGTISSGYSGGPMVDNDGNVIGIATGNDDNQSFATGSHEFVAVLTTIGIDFTKADGAPSVDEEKKEEANAEEEVKEEVPEPVQPATPAEPEKKTNYVPFIIGGAAVVLLGILAAVLLSRKKKNDAPEPAGATYAAGGPVPVNPVTGTGRPAGGAPVVPPAVSGGYPGGPTPDTSVLNQGSNETTVLGQGAGETSVLAETHIMGHLIREKNGEKINITRENFKIGRERSRVDYCISDNTAIGRHHATIIVRNDEAYLVDQNSRNFTFVNDVKVAPNVETKLQEGDKISFADEVYTYHVR